MNKPPSNKALQLLEALLYSNVWIALSAACQVYVGMRLLNLEPVAMPCFLAFCSMFWVYTFAKAVHFDPQADGINDPERTEFLVKYRPLLIGGGLTGLLYGLNATYQLGTVAFLSFISPTLAGLVYDLKVLPAQYKYRRLKDVPGVKGLTVALAWGLMPAGLLATFYPQVSRLGLLLFTLWSTVLWFINTTYFDLGDVRGDRAEGTRTLPIVLGFSATRRMLQVLNLLTATAVVLFAQFGFFDPCGKALGVMGVYQWILLYRAHDEDTDIQWECDLFADGVMVVSALCLLV